MIYLFTVSKNSLILRKFPPPTFQAKLQVQLLWIGFKSRLEGKFVAQPNPGKSQNSIHFHQVAIASVL